jgi:hypothetical protein
MLIFIPFWVHCLFAQTKKWQFFFQSIAVKSDVLLHPLLIRVCNHLAIEQRGVAWFKHLTEDIFFVGHLIKWLHHIVNTFKHLSSAEILILLLLIPLLFFFYLSKNPCLVIYFVTVMSMIIFTFSSLSINLWFVITTIIFFSFLITFIFSFVLLFYRIHLCLTIVKLFQ